MRSLKLMLFAAVTMLLFTTCKKDIEADPGFYFKASVPGKKLFLKEGKDYINEVPVNSGTGINGSDNRFFQNISFSGKESAWPRISVWIMQQFTYEPSSCNDIEEMFRLGPYPAYTQVTEGNVFTFTNGVGVYYYDETGVWSTHNGDQEGSTFEILEHIPNPDGLSRRITRIRFTCKMYGSNGNMFIMKNAEIRGRSVHCLR